MCWLSLTLDFKLTWRESATHGHSFPKLCRWLHSSWFPFVQRKISFFLALVADENCKHLLPSFSMDVSCKADISPGNNFCLIPFTACQSGVRSNKLSMFLLHSPKRLFFFSLLDSLSSDRFPFHFPLAPDCFNYQCCVFFLDGKLWKWPLVV